MMAIVWLHVVSMVLGFAALVAYDAVLIVAAKSKSAEFIQQALNSTAPAGLAGKILVIIGLLAGVHLAGKFGYGATWLVGSYVLMALSMFLGAVVLDPIRKRLLVAAVAGDRQIAEFRLGSVPLIVLYISSLCWAIVIGLMLAKP